MSKPVAVSLALTALVATVGSLALVDLVVFYAVAGGLTVAVQAGAFLLPHTQCGRRLLNRRASG